METEDLIRNLEFEYWAICAANPDWDKSLYDFLLDRNVTAQDIWEYSPGVIFTELPLDNQDNL